MDSDAQTKLAQEGGSPAITSPIPPMYPGGMRIDADEEAQVLEVLRTKRLFRYYGPNEGPSKTAQFEQEFAAYMGSAHALGVTSGTAALICGLAGLGIGPGMEVIVPAYTWIATASAVFAVGAVPIMAEVDDTLTLDAGDIENKITPYTRAIIPVHMRGNPCQMERVMDVARKHNLLVLEDTAQADGASYRGKHLGTFGDAGAFSLQFNKIITSGEGGAVITDDYEIYKRAVMYHDVVGGNRNNIPEDQILPGINFRMPELLAAVSLAQLRKLDKLLADMRLRQKMLMESMAGVAGRKGIQFRTSHDAEGDAGVALIFFLPDAEQTRAGGCRVERRGAASDVDVCPGCG